MTKFAVYDNDKAASTKAQVCLTPGNGWDNHEFNSLDEAIEYARDYFWPYSSPTQVGEIVDYSGYGDLAEIRQVTEISQSQLTSAYEDSLIREANKCRAIAWDEFGL